MMSREADTRLDGFSFPAFPAGARREIYIPSESDLVARVSPLKRGQVAQALIDCACVLIWIVLGSAGLIAVGGSFFCLLFVDLR
jgi:hypothetical protein